MLQWSCSECGATETNRRTKGKCHRCYHADYIKYRMALDPQYRAKESRANYQKHRARRIAASTERYRRLKWEVIERLGRVCSCCGESEPEFLTVDHIDGGGAAHRKRLSGTSRASSIMVYKDIKRQGFPTDRFRILCFNCNCAIGCWGYCPHSKSPSDLSRLRSDRSFVIGCSTSTKT